MFQRSVYANVAMGFVFGPETSTVFPGLTLGLTTDWLHHYLAPSAHLLAPGLYHHGLVLDWTPAWSHYC